MTFKCEIPSCGESGPKAYFPWGTDPTKMHAWLSSTGLRLEDVTKSGRVCWRHFKPWQLRVDKNNKVRLLPGRTISFIFAQGNN